MLMSTSEEGVFKEWPLWNKWEWIFEEKQEEPIDPIDSRFELLDL